MYFSLFYVIVYNVVIEKEKKKKGLHGTFSSIAKKCENKNTN